MSIVTYYVNVRVVRENLNSSCDRIYPTKYMGVCVQGGVLYASIFFISFNIS